MILQCENISKSFGKIQVLKNVNLHVKKREILTLLGDSGCGKSTLLRIFAGLEKSDKGRISLNGKIVANDKIFTQPQQRKIAFVFQDYALFPHLNIKQNIAFALKNVSDKETPINKISKILNIQDLLHKNPHELSGGQQQRVAIARALVVKPDLLLLDEPFSNLDTNLKLNVSIELRQIIKSLNIGAIMVTHNRLEALSMSDNIAILNKGIIEQLDNPKQIYDKPKSLHVAKFMGEISLIKQNGKTLAIRPENCIFDLKKGSFKGKVETIIFQGANKLLHIRLTNTKEILKVLVSGDFEVNMDDIGFVNVSKFISFD